MEVRVKSRFNRLRRSCVWLMWPSGWKKRECVQLTPDHGALDVANKTGMIQTEPSWLVLNTYIFQCKKKKVKNVYIGLFEAIKMIMKKEGWAKHGTAHYAGSGSPVSRAAWTNIKFQCRLSYVIKSFFSNSKGLRNTERERSWVLAVGLMMLRPNTGHSVWIRDEGGDRDL